MRLFVLVLLTGSSICHAANMDAQSFERVSYAICKDNSNVKLCSDLVSDLMFQVKSNTEIKILCDQVDEKGGDTASKPACMAARSVDDYLNSKKAIAQ